MVYFPQVSRCLFRCSRITADTVRTDFFLAWISHRYSVSRRNESPRRIIGRGLGLSGDFRRTLTHTSPTDAWATAQFMTEQSAYFKSDKCRDLDQHLGDIHSFITGNSFSLASYLCPHLSSWQSPWLPDKEIEIGSFSFPHAHRFSFHSQLTFISLNNSICFIGSPHGDIWADLRRFECFCWTWLVRPSHDLNHW